MLFWQTETNTDHIWAQELASTHMKTAISERSPKWHLEQRTWANLNRGSMSPNPLRMTPMWSPIRDPRGGIFWEPLQKAMFQKMQYPKHHSLILKWLVFAASDRSEWQLQPSLSTRLPHLSMRCINALLDYAATLSMSRHLSLSPHPGEQKRDKKTLQFVNCLKAPES